MKLSKKWMLVVALLLSVAMLTTGTLAYLTDADSRVNTFTVGNVDIEVDETFEPDSPLNPGVEVEKKAGVTNVHEINPAWVWMTVSVPEELDEYLELGWEANANATKLDEPVHEGYVSYLVLHPEKLGPGETTPMYLEDVMLNENVDYQNGQYVAIVDGQPQPIGQLSDVNIIVDGFAMQPEGFEDVQSAYDAYVGQWEGLNGGSSTGTPVEDVEELVSALEEGGEIIYTGDEDVVIDTQLDMASDLKLDLGGADLVFEDGGKIVAKDGVQITLTDANIVADGSNTIFEVTNSSVVTLGSGVVLEDVTSETSSALIKMYDYGAEDAKLVLDGAIIRNNDNGGKAPIVDVGYGTGVVIEEGTKITGNTVTGKSSNGNAYGVINLSSGAELVINGGEISDNSYGDRALINLGGGTFVFNDGVITGNESTGTMSAITLISMANGSVFEMNGGEITGNNVGTGTVLSVGSGSATINGGSITGNTANKTVSVGFGTFTKDPSATVDGY